MSEANEKHEVEGATEEGAPEQSVHHGRRAAVTKLAYASPVVAGLLFSSRRAAASPGDFEPPPKPGG